MEEVKMAFVVPEMQEMQEGGVALPTTQEQLDSIFSAFPGTYTLEEFNMFPKQTQQMLITRALIEKGTKAKTPSVTTQPFYSPSEVKTRLNEIIESRIELAKQSAVMPQTKQGGILGFASQVNALRADQADKIKALATGSKEGLDKNTIMPADLITAMTKPEVQETRKFNDIIKTAKTTAEALSLDPTVFVQHAIAKDDSPTGFKKELPQYSGERVYGELAYNIDDFIAKKHKEFGTDMSVPFDKYQNTAIALREWIALNKL